MRNCISFFPFLLMSIFVAGQSNIFTSKQATTDILQGNYQTVDNYLDIEAEAIGQYLLDEINSDSLFNYMLALQQFENRNTGSDTLSSTRGIGAARRMIYSYFEKFNIENGSLSIVDFLEFDHPICNVIHHKNVLMVHPGNIPEAGVVIIEAHMDSRCETACDSDCIAHGMEDNGSGTALVMELARVMTKHTYDKTLVFMCTTAEEQGLFGAEAMAKFCVQNDVKVKTVLNNDVIGGILCGETASPPGCPGPGHVDSTQVRLFSFGGSLSSHKGLARFVKMTYDDRVQPLGDVGMLLSIMSAEDRTGRGGDHIPFRENGFPAIRFTAANENGDAQIDDDYHDHQHSTRDVLGIDLDGDGVFDSLFVDFNYLKRNTVINGIAAGIIAVNGDIPIMEVEDLGDSLKVTMISSNPIEGIRIGTRTDQNDFDSLYTFNGTDNATIPVDISASVFFVSGSVINSEGAPSCFSEEQFVFVNAVDEVNSIAKQIKLLQNRPNPFDESTIISWHVEGKLDYKKAQLIITNSSGSILQENNVKLNEGLNEHVFTHGWGTQGIYYYSLIVDDRLVETKDMIFAY